MTREALLGLICPGIGRIGGPTLFTVVTDIYREGDKGALLKAIGSILSYGSWSKEGAYAYWEVGAAAPILRYTGIGDLRGRFRNHNLDEPSPGNHRKDIDAHFQNQQDLGFSLVLFSGANISGAARDMAAHLEGAMLGSKRAIEALKTDPTRRLWNDASGSSAGQRARAAASAGELDFWVRALTGRSQIFSAGTTIRALSASPKLLAFERALMEWRILTYLGKGRLGGDLKKAAEQAWMQLHGTVPGDILQAVKKSAYGPFAPQWGPQSP